MKDPGSNEDLERVSVSITVKGVEQVHGRGELIGLAVVELDVAGVVILLQGVQVVRRADASLLCRAPQFRRQNGVWTSSIILPPAVSDAVGSEVIAHLLGPKDRL